MLNKYWLVVYCKNKNLEIFWLLTLNIYTKQKNIIQKKLN